MTQDSRSTDAIADELRRIIDQAEQLLGAVGGDGQLGALRERVTDTLGQARAKLSDLEREARATGKRATVATETWVRTNPWTALAIGAGIGLIIGAVLLGRSGPTAVPDDADVG